MSGLLNVGMRALQANQIALQTAGHNIANVNTPGYSRQSVILQTVQGTQGPGGYVGKGVTVQTIQRNYSEFLTTQATMAGAAQSADVTRADKLKQLENLFPGGSTGLGASINDMLNAFSDVASAPTDLTARTVVLTRVDETAARIRTTAQNLDDLQLGISQELGQKTNVINTLAVSISQVNEKIIRAQGADQPPNDLLDQRDQLVRELNQYVQTTSLAASDGSMSIFIGGSQPLVLGTMAATVSIVKDDYGDPLKSKLAVSRNGFSVTLDENTLGGGSVSGLLRFQNTDLVEGRNLLGRMTLAVTRSMNDQHALGLDLDGKPGGNLFSPVAFGTKNVLIPTAPAVLNQGTATVTVSINDATLFSASDYEVNFTSATAGNITRRSDGLMTAFPQTPATAPILATLDGLSISMPSGTPVAGDRFLIKPFSTSASSVSREFSSPRALAVASPVAASVGSTNRGSLSVDSLVTRSATALAAITLTFDGLGNYTRSDTGATTYPFTPGVAIESAPATLPATPGWAIKLKGAPQAFDTITIGPQRAEFRNLNAGNANAMMSLRDVAMFDGADLTDGYAGLIAQIGVRGQGANFAAEVSSTIASNLERDRTSVAGVNLDEEAAKLLQFQQAYQASAKMIQIAQGIFDTLIQSLGR
jgi:flagellar hook-associated protein 1 FlgK